MTRVYLELKDEHGQTTNVSYDVSNDMSPGDWQFMFESALTSLGFSRDMVESMFTKEVILDNTWRAIKECFDEHDDLHYR